MSQKSFFPVRKSLNILIDDKKRLKHVEQYKSPIKLHTGILLLKQNSQRLCIKRTKERFPDRYNHQWPTHHAPVAAKVLDISLNHVEQQRRIQWQIELLLIHKLTIQ